MQRWHLVELEDLPWVPRAVRDGARDVLDWMFTRAGWYRPVVDRLRALVDATGAATLVDLGSGGGGGALAMRAYLQTGGAPAPALVLTDVFPSASAAERVDARGDAGVRYHRAPVDACAVPPELSGVRTMYSALHHFRPAEVRRLIAAAVADRAPLASFDVAASPFMRKVPGVLVPLLMIPNFVILFVLTFFLVPMVRPVRASRLGFTYLVPLIPIVYGWDGTVSALRAYRADELAALARAVPGADGYVWEAGTAGQGPKAVVYLTGRPR